MDLSKLTSKPLILLAPGVQIIETLVGDSLLETAKKVIKTLLQIWIHGLLPHRPPSSSASAPCSATSASADSASPSASAKWQRKLCTWVKTSLPSVPASSTQPWCGDDCHDYDYGDYLSSFVWYDSSTPCQNQLDIQIQHDIQTTLSRVTPGTMPSSAMMSSSGTSFWYASMKHYVHSKF